MSDVIELDMRYRRRRCMAKTFEVLGALHDLKRLQGLSRDEQMDVHEATQIIQQLVTKLDEETSRELPR